MNHLNILDPRNDIGALDFREHDYWRTLVESGILIVNFRRKRLANDLKLITNLFYEDTGMITVTVSDVFPYGRSEQAELARLVDCFGQYQDREDMFVGHLPPSSERMNRLLKCYQLHANHQYWLFVSIEHGAEDESKSVKYSPDLGPVVLWKQPSIWRTLVDLNLDYRTITVYARRESEFDMIKSICLNY